MVIVIGFRYGDKLLGEVGYWWEKVGGFGCGGVWRGVFYI